MNAATLSSLLKAGADDAAAISAPGGGPPLTYRVLRALSHYVTSPDPQALSLADFTKSLIVTPPALV